MPFGFWDLDGSKIIGFFLIILFTLTDFEGECKATCRALAVGALKLHTSFSSCDDTVIDHPLLTSMLWNHYNVASRHSPGSSRPFINLARISVNQRTSSMWQRDDCTGLSKSDSAAQASKTVDLTGYVLEEHGAIQQTLPKLLG